MPVLAKVAIALLTGGFGYWTWQSANRWLKDGEIPAVWNEGMNTPVKSGEKGFSSFIIWQKLMASIAWLFCGMCLGSIVLSDVFGFW